MVKSLDSICGKARSYYHDYLCHIIERIPPDILNHINSCPHCQNAIAELREKLEKLESGEQDVKELRDQWIHSAIADNLTHHFEFTEQWISCSQVKAFLAGLSHPELEIKIPTPITAHIDNCPACLDDYKTITGLRLEPEQLTRLGTLFAHTKRPSNPLDCSVAQDAISAVAALRFEGVSQEILTHLCTCPTCNNRLYKARETLIEHIKQPGPNEKASGKTAPEAFCEVIAPFDIFDFVVPFEFNPAYDEYSEHRLPDLDHYRNCPVCFNKIQQLHKTIFFIYSRSDSPITIRFRDGKGKSSPAESSQGEPPTHLKFPGVPGETQDNWSIEARFMGQPIELEKLRTTVGLETACACNTVTQRKSSTGKWNRRLKPVAAAAVLMIAAAVFFLNMPTASAVNISQIYQAIAKVKNVYVASFVPGEPEPIQEKWVSRTYGFRLTRDSTGSVLWDVENKVKKIKPMNSDAIKTSSLSPDIANQAKKTLEGSLGLIPFSDMSDIPEDAQWEKVDEKSIRVNIPGTEVYDLIWEKKKGSFIRYRKWRVFVDIDTKLPKKTEWYRQFSPEDGYEFFRFVKVTYPSDNEIENTIQSKFN